MKPHTRWIVVAVVVVIALLYLWLRPASRHSTAGEDQLLYDRVWVDRTPKGGTDYFHALLVLRNLPVGVIQKASSYHVELERFDYLAERGGVRVRFPQHDRQDRFTYRVYPCHELPPNDLCLELSKGIWGSAPRRFYSQREQRSGKLEVRMRDALAH